MTAHRRYQLARAAGAFTVGVIGTGCVRAQQWWPAAKFALTALVLIEASVVRVKFSKLLADSASLASNLRGSAEFRKSPPSHVAHRAAG
ncbi:hypothetical protein [Streptomyces sp. NPDC058297]|uniref:hypothetical protein n=1 Tax=Streptomyces sp. NPDC058297 TaxID=3346433 RepID=UPI0036ED38D8